MKNSVGRFSPSKKNTYDWLQSEPYELPAELSGPFFDQLREQARKEGDRLRQSMEARLHDDAFHETMDALHTSYTQKQHNQSPDYAILGLTNHEGRLVKKDVRNAYRRQARKLHPDVGGTDEAFQELHAAYRRVLASIPKE